MAFTKNEWWHTDKEGRRIGWLWPEDMIATLGSFYGDRWVTTFADQFGFSRSAVDRWKDGKTPIPKHVAMIITMLATMRNKKLPVSPIDASWLPVGDGANSPQPEAPDADS